MTPEQRNAVIQKLCKWRGVFAGWQLGTRSKDDPECQAVRDHRELTMLLRIEVTALVGVLIKKGIITTDEFTEEVAQEAVLLDKDYEHKFPGLSTTQDGVIYQMPEAGETMKGWKP